MEDAGMIRNVAVPERRVERAACPRCGVEARFITGDYGQSLQVCGCGKGAIIPDPNAPPPPMSSAERLSIKRALTVPRPPGRPRGNPNFGRRSS